MNKTYTISEEQLKDHHEIFKFYANYKGDFDSFKSNYQPLSQSEEDKGAEEIQALIKEIDSDLLDNMADERWGVLYKIRNKLMALSYPSNNEVTNQVKQVEHEEIMRYINFFEIKKEPEWTNTIKNNLVVFYSWLKSKYAIPKEESKEWRTKLFNYMDKEHSVQLLDSDMNDIQHICFPPDYPYTH